MVLFIKLDVKNFINSEGKHMDKLSENLKLRNVPENIDELDEKAVLAALKDVNYNINVLMAEVKKLQKSSL